MNKTMSLNKNRIRSVSLIVGMVFSGLFLIVSFLTLLNFMITYKYYIHLNYPYDEWVSVCVLEQQLKMIMLFCVFALVFSALTFIVEVLLILLYPNEKSIKTISPSASSEDWFFDYLSCILFMVIHVVIKKHSVQSFKPEKILSSRHDPHHHIPAPAPSLL